MTSGREISGSGPVEWPRIPLFAAAFTAGGVAVGAAVATGRMDGFGSVPMGVAAAVIAVALAGAASVLEVRRSANSRVRQVALGLGVALALVLAGWVWTTLVLLGAAAESQLVRQEVPGACLEDFPAEALEASLAGVTAT